MDHFLGVAEAEVEVGIPSKVTLGDREEVQVVEDYYLTDASQVLAEELLEKSR
jgi:hypothetical protein